MFDAGRLLPLLPSASRPAWQDYCHGLQAQLDEAALCRRHGDAARWLQALATLPLGDAKAFAPARDAVTTGPDSQHVSTDTLMQFHPWRKGPFQLHGHTIDCEWRSDWKWQRIRDALGELHGQHVLDVGCGNGYHLWRLLGEGAAAAVGVDPTLVYFFQFEAVRKLAGLQAPAFLIPDSFEALPDSGQFDLVLSMGVIYHRRDPFEHLDRLARQLRPGGQLLLESLVVPGGADTVLLPTRRYARMRNVWLLPSSAALATWLTRCGFRHIRCVHEADTSVEEQRRTDWMTFESLAESLQANQDLTVEGLPRPRRAALIATRG